MNSLFEDYWIDDEGWLYANDNQIIVLTTHVEIISGNRTKQYWVKLGYNVPDRGKSFTVFIGHLKHGNDSLVDVFCPECKEIRSLKFKTLTKAGHSICHKCITNKTHFRDLTGLEVGKLKVIRHVGKDKWGMALWECQCECENFTIVRRDHLFDNSTLSCGCLQAELAREAIKDWKGENHPCWKGGIIRSYGPNWQEQREKARERDNYCCQRCGLPEADNRQELDVHHITPFRTFLYIPNENDYYIEANDLSNLISLCPNCHRIVETDYNRLFDFS